MAHCRRSTCGHHVGVALKQLGQRRTLFPRRVTNIHDPSQTKTRVLRRGQRQAISRPFSSSIRGARARNAVARPVGPFGQQLHSSLGHRLSG